MILRSLGSNFTIKGGILDIDLQKPFIAFKGNSEMVNAKLETIEPGVLVGITPNNKVFEDWFFKWSGWRDSNPRPHAPHACALANCATPRR